MRLELVVTLSQVAAALTHAAPGGPSVVGEGLTKRHRGMKDHDFVSTYRFCAFDIDRDDMSDRFVLFNRHTGLPFGKISNTLWEKPSFDSLDSLELWHFEDDPHTPSGLFEIVSDSQIESQPKILAIQANGTIGFVDEASCRYEGKQQHDYLTSIWKLGCNAHLHAGPTDLESKHYIFGIATNGSRALMAFRPMGNAEAFPEFHPDIPIFDRSKYKKVEPALIPYGELVKIWGHPAQRLWDPLPRCKGNNFPIHKPGLVALSETICDASFLGIDRHEGTLECCVAMDSCLLDCDKTEFIDCVGAFATCAFNHCNVFQPTQTAEIKRCKMREALHIWLAGSKLARYHFDRMNKEFCECVFECPPHYDLCSDKCVNLGFDKNHCGGCDEACAEGGQCVEGACITECPENLSLCPTGCQNLQGSALNCGRCGAVCESSLLGEATPPMAGAAPFFKDSDDDGMGLMRHPHPGICERGQCLRMSCSTPRRCDEFVTGECGYPSGCICGTMSTGRGVCTATIPCKGLTHCIDDNGCPDGWACLMHSCCDTNVCVEENCSNPADRIERAIAREALDNGGWVGPSIDRPGYWIEGYGPGQ